MNNNDAHTTVVIGGALMRAFGIDPNTVRSFTLSMSAGSEPSLAVTHIMPNFDMGKWDESIVQYTLKAEAVAA